MHMTPPDDQLLPPGATCPMCGYEFGVPNARDCPECGLAVGDVVRQVIRDRASVRSRSMVNALAFHIATATIFALAVELIPASALRPRLDGQSRHTFIATCLAIVAASLVLGLAASTLARRGERLLWADLWARTHLVMFTPWLLIPISRALPLDKSAVWHCGLWTSLAACIACGVAVTTLLAHRRRQLLLTARLPAAAITTLYILQIITVVLVTIWMPYARFALGSIIGV